MARARRRRTRENGGRNDRHWPRRSPDRRMRAKDGSRAGTARRPPPATRRRAMTTRRHESDRRKERRYSRPLGSSRAFPRTRRSTRCLAVALTPGPEASRTLPLSPYSSTVAADGSSRARLEHRLLDSLDREGGRSRDGGGGGDPSGGPSSLGSDGIDLEVSDSETWGTAAAAAAPAAAPAAALLLRLMLRSPSSALARARIWAVCSSCEIPAEPPLVRARVHASRVQARIRGEPTLQTPRRVPRCRRQGWVWTRPCEVCTVDGRPSIDSPWLVSIVNLTRLIGARVERFRLSDRDFCDFHRFLLSTPRRRCASRIRHVPDDETPCADVDETPRRRAQYTRALVSRTNAARLSARPGARTSPIASNRTGSWGARLRAPAGSGGLLLPGASRPRGLASRRWRSSRRGRAVPRARASTRRRRARALPAHVDGRLPRAGLALRAGPPRLCASAAGHCPGGRRPRGTTLCSADGDQWRLRRAGGNATSAGSAFGRFAAAVVARACGGPTHLLPARLGREPPSPALNDPVGEGDGTPVSSRTRAWALPPATTPRWAFLPPCTNCPGGGADSLPVGAGNRSGVSTAESSDYGVFLPAWSGCTSMATARARRTWDGTSTPRPGATRWRPRAGRGSRGAPTW